MNRPPTLRKRQLSLAIDFVISSMFGAFLLVQVWPNPWAIAAIVGLEVLRVIWLRRDLGRESARYASSDAREKALALAPRPDAAFLIVIRTSEIAGSTPMHVAVDKRTIAEIDGPSFVAQYLPPGEVGLSAALVGPSKGKSSPGFARVALGAGEVAVFVADVAMDDFQTYIAWRQIDIRGTREILAGLPMARAA